MDPVTKAISTNFTGSWLLTEDLYVLDGITLRIAGTSVGGYSDEFYLLSKAQTYLNLRAHGGSLDINFTAITTIMSWDD